MSKPIIGMAPRHLSLAERIAWIRARQAQARRAMQGRRGLGDLPEDIALEHTAKPPILNAREVTFTEEKKALENQLPRWHKQQLNNFVVQIGLQSSKILAFNENRAYVIFINDSLNVVRLGFSHEADLISGIPLAASGGFFEPILGHIGDVYAITTVAAQNLLVVEGQYV